VNKSIGQGLEGLDRLVMEHIVVSSVDTSDLVALEMEEKYGVCNGNNDTLSIVIIAIVCWGMMPLSSESKVRECRLIESSSGMLHGGKGYGLVAARLSVGLLVS